MPMQRSPDSAKARTLYRKGMKLTEIADRLGVPASTVRRWKATQKWDKESAKTEGKPALKASAEPERKASVKPERKASAKGEHQKPKKKVGAPPGNVNAVGHKSSTPYGNQRAVKHGAYRAPNRDTLSEDELSVIEAMEDAPEMQLVYQIQMYTISERRMMKAINKLSGVDKKAPGEMGVFVEEAVREESKRTFKSEEEEEQYREAIQRQVNKGDRLPGEHYKLTTVTRSTLDPLTRIQQQLTTVQSKKVEAIKALHQLRMDKRQEEAEEKGNSAINAWVETLMELEGGKSDG